MTIVDGSTKGKSRRRAAPEEKTPPHEELCDIARQVVAEAARASAPVESVVAIARARIAPCSLDVPHREPDEDLTESIRENGVIQPLIVRPRAPGKYVMRPDGGTLDYELVVGERRFMAAGIAGLADVPCIVRELDDDEVLVIAYQENRGRQDLTPMQEAKFFSAFLRRSKVQNDNGQECTTAELARRVKKSERYVVQRLKLLELPETAQNAVPSRVLLGAALECACLPDSAQRAEAFALVLVKEGSPPLPVAEARAIITARFHLRMVNASFPIDDAQLVATAPSCMVCPKRTGNQMALSFDGLADDDRCADRDCWNAKTAAWKDRQAVDEPDPESERRPSRQPAATARRALSAGTAAGGNSAPAQPWEIDQLASALLLRRIIEGLVPIAEATTPKPGPTWWRTLIAGLAPLLDHVAIAALCRRRSWTNARSSGETLRDALFRRAASMPETELRGLLVEVISLLQPEAARALAKGFGLDVKKLAAASTRDATAELRVKAPSDAAAKRPAARTKPQRRTATARARKVAA